MKLEIVINRTITETTEIEVNDISEVKAAVQALTRDDFQETDDGYNMEILTEEGEDIYGQIQPWTPNLS